MPSKRPLLKKKPIKVDKRELLINSAIELFEKQGFWNTSTAQIAKHAGVATGSLFNYFPSKEDLQDEIFIHIRSELFAALTAESHDDFLTNFEYLFRTYTLWCLNNPIKHNLLTQLKILKMVSKKTEANVEKGYEIFTGPVGEQLKENGIFKPMTLSYAMMLINYQLEANIDYIKQTNLDADAIDQQIEFAHERLLASLVK